LIKIKSGKCAKITQKFCSKKVLSGGSNQEVS